MNVDHFKTIRKTLPQLPGVYQFYNKDNTIIYVGKAISLRSRVTSYFRSSKQMNRKTKELVQHINHIDWIACPDEHDALLLENNLIKKWQPKYNINLKDDKTYPYIVINDEPFPRVYMSRRKSINNNSEYYGPYTSIVLIRELLQHIRESIPLRTCKLNLSQKAIDKGKYRPCLEYHIEKCKAPCVGYQTQQDYNHSLDEIRMLLKGNFKSVVQCYKKIMKDKSDQLLYEEAQAYKEKIDAIDKLKHKSFFDFDSEEDIDLCCFREENQILWVNFSMLRQGSILQSKTFDYPIEHIDISDETFATIIIDLRTKFGSDCDAVLSNRVINVSARVFKVKVPGRGMKKEMIDWAMSNIEQHVKNRLVQEQKKENQLSVLHEMKKQLHLSSLPLHIESFDNSHFQGDSQVSAMVCFKNGLPSKKEYRTFHIKSTDKIDDYASMREVIYRRYLRRINEGKSLPDLIIIDGGKGQLNEAVKSLEVLSLRDKISILSIAKKQEHLFFYGDKEPLILDRKNPILMLIQQIRDETHRFVIGFHRKTQIKKSLRSFSK